MCLRFVFLLITRVVAWLRVSRREDAWKIAEILILRHQLAVLQRQQPRRPKLNWADRALLAALLSVIPKARRQGLRLLITQDTILRWHRDIIGCRQAGRSMRGKTGRPATRRNIRALLPARHPGAEASPCSASGSPGRACWPRQPHSTAERAAIAEPRAPAMSRSGTSAMDAAYTCSSRRMVCWRTHPRNQSRKCGAASTTPPPRK